MTERIVRAAVARKVAEWGAGAEVSATLGIPPHPEFGDFATSVAMQLARPVGKKPRSVAEEIAAAIRAEDDQGWIRELSVQGPGFINITLSEEPWREALAAAIEQGRRFGSSDAGAGQRVLLEFVSANPTGPLHVGHGRGAAVGDALAKRAAGEEKEAPAKPPEAAKEPALRVLRVDRAAVENARIAFLDRTVPGAKELYVDDLDVEVRDLETGKPLEVVLRAAVLQEKQNVLLQVKAAPLPASLQPVPEEVVLKVEPIVLDPLAPFLGKQVGFRGGRFEADLDARLGAAVPGGAGPTRVKGGFHATRLAFAGQEGGKALDAGLDADLDADMAKGDLRIGRLDLTFGPLPRATRALLGGFALLAPLVDFAAEPIHLVSAAVEPR